MLSRKAWAEKASAGVVGFKLAEAVLQIDPYLETQAGVMWDAAFGIHLSSPWCDHSKTQEGACIDIEVQMSCVCYSLLRVFQTSCSSVSSGIKPAQVARLQVKGQKVTATTCSASAVAV